MTSQTKLGSLSLRKVVPMVAALSIFFLGVEERLAFSQGNQVTHSVSADQRIEVFRINEPTVTQSLTAYPTIKFLWDDQVTIEAGGCVLTDVELLKTPQLPFGGASASDR